MTADGRTRALPVRLEVLDFALPNENSMNMMVFHESRRPVLYQGREMDDVYHRFAHRQRIELVQAYNEGKVNRFIGRIKGGDFTPKRGYEGPGEGERNRYLGAITFVYAPDEPSRKAFAYIRKIADNIHSNPGPGKRLPLFVTHEYTTELDGAIDIWDSGPQGYDVAKAEAERAKGHDYWIYNGGWPWGGAIAIDTPATDPRATIRGCYKHGTRIYFYWHGDHWRYNSKKQGNRIQNVWADLITFDNRGQPNKPIEDQNFANGDGVLLYPVEERQHPVEDRGIAGPCSTIQLANFRRGLQDHQYLTLAWRQGLEDLVQDSLRQVVPRMFSDASETAGFSEKGDDYERARYQLAKAIEASLKRH